MYIISTFEQSIKLETAITALEIKGIPKGNILAVPMDKKNEDRMLFDRLHSSDGLSLLDLPMISGTVFTLFGVIYGFLLHLGPILWGLFGTGFGVGVGILIKLYTTRRHKKKQMAKTTEVVLMVACKESQMEMVQETLWSYFALGVSKLNIGDEV